MNTTPKMFYEDLIHDVLANEFIIGAAILMFVLFLCGMVITRRHGAAHPIAYTISEGMPVLGLMGTFIGALYIFYFSKEDSINGVVVAFSVSFLGWALYLSMQFYGAFKSKTATQVSQENLDMTLSMVESVEKLDAKLESSLTQFIAINEVLQSISQTTGLSSINSLEAAAKGCNDQLREAAQNIKLCAENMERLEKQAERPIELNIKPPSDTRSLVMGLEPVAEIFERIQNINTAHSITLAMPENLETHQQQLTQLRDILHDIDQTPKQVDIDISLSEHVAQTQRILNDLSISLKEFSKIPKSHSISLEIENDISSLEKLGRITTDLQQTLVKLTGQDHMVTVGVSLPPAMEKQIEIMNGLKHSLAELQQLERTLDYSIAVEGVSENGTKDLETIRNLMESLNALHKHIRFDVGLNITEDMEATLDRVERLKETIAHLEQKSEDISVRTHTDNREQKARQSWKLSNIFSKFNRTKNSATHDE